MNAPPEPAPPRPDPISDAPPGPRRVSRRAVLGGAAVAAIAVGGAAVVGPWATRDERQLTELWRRPRVGSVVQTTPDGLVVFTAASSGLVAVDVRTGQERWTSPDSSTWWVGESGSDALYVANFDEITCLDLATGRRRWGAAASLLAPVGTTVLVLTDQGLDTEIRGLRSADGSIAWSRPIPYPRDRGAVVGRDGLAHLSLGEQLITLDAASGRELWRRTDDVAVLQTVERLGDLLLLGVAPPPMALDVRTGLTRPAPSFPDWTTVALIRNLGSGFVALADDGSLTAWNADGSSAWTTPAPADRGTGPMRYPLLGGTDTVLVLTRQDDGERQGALHIRAHDAEDGGLLFTARGPVVDPSVRLELVGDTLVLVDDDLAIALGSLGR